MAKRLFLIGLIFTLLMGSFYALTNVINEVSAKEPESVTTQKPNFRYQPKPGLTWQWQLNGPLNLSYTVDLYDIDLFDTNKEAIVALHQRGIKVICYFSAGSYEKGRPDSDQFAKSLLGKPLEGWPDERWLNIKDLKKIAPIMRQRLDLAVQKQCDGVEPDNVDGYQNETGFSLTAKDQLRFNRWLATEAHRRRLAIGLKNDLDQIPALIKYFDFAVNEQCFQYSECTKLLPFIRQGKAVLGVEYELSPAEFCKKANAWRFSWLKMDYELAGGRTACIDHGV